MAVKLARFSWIPGGLAAALVIAFGRIAFPSLGESVETGLYDRVMATMATQPAQDVAIVAIDDASLEALGEWPWPRDVHADLLEHLRGAHARVVAFTMPIDDAWRTSETERLRAALALLESSNLGASDQARQLRRLLGAPSRGRDPDTHLAKLIGAHGNVVLPVELRVGEPSTQPVDLSTRFFPEAGSAPTRAAPAAAIVRAPGAIFTNAAGAVGHGYLPADADGKVRTDLAAARVSSVLLPSLAVAIAARATGLAPNEMRFVDDTLQLARHDVPLEAGLRLRPHRFPESGSRAISQYPYWQVLAGEVPAEQLRDKIVLIGITSKRLPMDIAPYAGTDENLASSPVLIIAGTVSSLLSGTLYARPSAIVLAEWIAGAAVVAFAALALPAMGAAVGSLATILLIAVLALTEVGLLGAAQLWAKFMLACTAALAGLAAYLVSELLRRANIRHAKDAVDSAANLRALGQTFQRQGQLDLAFETYRRYPLDAPTMELMYQLGLDFERRAQRPKASAVYTYIASRDPHYRDLKNRMSRVREEPLARPTGNFGTHVERGERPGPAGLPALAQNGGRAASKTRGNGEAASIGRNDPGSAASSWATTIPALDEPEDSLAPFDRYALGSGGRTLGRYQIERELGKGAMGTVYLGRDPHINRVVAIKAIPLAEEFAEDDLEEARARFFREAEMAGRLNHPAIVTVYDAGEDQGLAYIAMEYLRGQHLSHFTAPAQLLPARRVMQLAARVADALHYAHRQNVIHRDIKPANIMFDADTDELKITDFGIARLADVSRTKTGIVLGTPSFMSPEQLEGRSIDGRSDQFSLGISLYQLLCGQLPFRADSMPRLMHKIATEPHAPIRVLQPELPECIDSIFARVLAKSADDRYVNCAEFGAALRECAGAMAPQHEPKHEWLIP
ncbi:serine/threonine protein kinase [Steroidobacter denitrificans]|uniref:Serine/threonine protein kinase n=1 Tax=Steroidobacter denitrificans TaxID=465721 RepID=A0A127F7H5_STEDE|nr:serine/threonine-protein kinase [Steroidobacter denitrificans]AMN46396.1 serine/threonine protein kinase [Steroidobacter denitrificans]